MHGWGSYPGCLPGYKKGLQRGWDERVWKRGGTTGRTSHTAQGWWLGAPGLGSFLLPSHPQSHPAAATAAAEWTSLGILAAAAPSSQLIRCCCPAPTQPPGCRHDREQYLWIHLWGMNPSVRMYCINFGWLVVKWSERTVIKRGTVALGGNSSTPATAHRLRCAWPTCAQAL